MNESRVQEAQRSGEVQKSNFARFSIYTAIAILVAAGLLIVTFVLTGVTGDIVFRAFVTLALLAGFSFAIIGETTAVESRKDWVTLAHVAAWVLALGAGVWHIWATVNLNGDPLNYNVSGGEFIVRTFLFFLTVGALKLTALGYSALAYQLELKRISPPFLTVLKGSVAVFTIAALMLALPLTFPHLFSDLEGYWRVFTAVAIIGSVTLLIPFISRALNPQEPASQPGNVGLYRIPQARQTAPAGWYPTSDPLIEHFWNGDRWTGYTRPAGVDQEEPPTTTPREN